MRGGYADLPAAGVPSIVEADGRNYDAALGVLVVDSGLPDVPIPLSSARFRSGAGRGLHCIQFPVQRDSDCGECGSLPNSSSTEGHIVEMVSSGVHKPAAIVTVASRK